MINIKDVPVISAEYLKSFYPLADKIQIEEIELSEDRLNCSITLSYEEQLPTGGFVFLNTPKTYKTFKVDMTTGEVLSMKIRVFK